MTVNGIVNADAFGAFARRVLSSTLLAREVVDLGTLSSRNGPNAPRLAEAAGALLLHIPAYSPDLNPL